MPRLSSAAALPNIATPTVQAGRVLIYGKSDRRLYYVGDDGLEVGPVAESTFVVGVSAGATANPTDLILANATAGPFTVTLPSAPLVGTVVSVKKTDASANVVTVVGQGTSTIDGDTNATLVSRYAGADFTFDGTNWQVTSLASAAAAASYVSGQTGFRNTLRNGNFDIWQRGPGPITAGAFPVADGWSPGAGVAGTTVSRVAATLGELPDSRYYMAQAVTGQTNLATDYSAFNQRIESVATLSGQQVTVSFYAKASAGTPKVGVEIIQSFGAGGTPSADVQVSLGAITISTTMTRYSLTFTVPSVLGKTLGTGGNDFLQLGLFLSAGSNFATRASNIGSQNATFTFAKFQLEAGILTPFEARPIEVELAHCQRYYLSLKGTSAGSQPLSPIGVCGSTSSANLPIIFPVTMRATPTISAVGSSNIFDGSAIPAVTSVAMANATAVNGLITVSASAAGLTIGRAAYIVASNAAAELNFNAEL